MKPEKDTHSCKLTADGSHTVYSQRFEQDFHNPNGAIAESRHVFFEETGIQIDLLNNKTISIAETGFGTGLNLLLLLEYITKLNCKPKIDYYAVEGYPLKAELVSKLNYLYFLALPEYLPNPSTWFTELENGWNHITITPQITLHLFIGTFDEWHFEPESIDYFFHDPFSIENNPEGWSKSLFEKLFKAAKPSAILSTYAAATKVRAAMAAAGWQLASAPGALGKREMTVASPDAGQLTEFDILKVAHLKERYRNEFGDG